MNKTIKQAERYETPVVNVVEVKFHNPILVGSNEVSEKEYTDWDD